MIVVSSAAVGLPVRWFPTKEADIAFCTVAIEIQLQIKASGIKPLTQLASSDHISPDRVAQAIARLAGPEVDPFRGTDFSLKANEGSTVLVLLKVD